MAGDAWQRPAIGRIPIAAWSGYALPNCGRAMRQLLTALLLPALMSLIAPCAAGDLGLHDQYLTGVRAKAQRHDQTEFDASGSKIIFTPNRLEIILDRQHTIWMQEKNERFFGNIDFDLALSESYIAPSQVLNFDYHVQHGTGIAFKIFYKARNGEKSLASVIFRDENTAKSFHNTFLLWLNGKLGSAIRAK